MSRETRLITEDMTHFFVTIIIPYINNTNALFSKNENQTNEETKYEMLGENKMAK